MSKRHSDDEYGGFKVLEVRKENHQHDWHQVGQGFPIEVHRKDGGPNKPDTYVATTQDGRHAAEGDSEAAAAQSLRQLMTDLAFKGEL
jgi:hypothetical protein